MYVALIAFFNYYYTFLQLEPKDLADSLKRQACFCAAQDRDMFFKSSGLSLVSKFLWYEMLRHDLSCDACVISREFVLVTTPEISCGRTCREYLTGHLVATLAQGASIAGVRPGRKTADYITGTLERMSILGSAFLGALAAAPAAVEAITKLTAFRGFAGTSVLILVSTHA